MAGIGVLLIELWCNQPMCLFITGSENISDRNALAIFLPGTFTLIGRRCAAPIKNFLESSLYIPPCCFI